MSKKQLKASIIKQAMAQIGRKGGNNRAKALTAARRKEIAENAAKARWSKKPLSPS